MVNKVAPPAQGQLGPLGPIQIIPPGLLGLLQLKQLGRLPDKLADTVAGVIELRDWYLTSRRVDVFALFASAAAPTTVPIATGGIGGNGFKLGGVDVTVPSGQIWWVEQFGATGAGALAADVFSFQLAVRNNNNSTVIPVSVLYQDVVTARVRFYVAKADRGFWAFPGDAFTVLVTDISSAGITLTMSMRATPCQI